VRYRQTGRVGTRPCVGSITAEVVADSNPGLPKPGVATLSFVWVCYSGDNGSHSIARQSRPHRHSLQSISLLHRFVRCAWLLGWVAATSQLTVGQLASSVRTADLHEELPVVWVHDPASDRSLATLAADGSGSSRLGASAPYCRPECATAAITSAIQSLDTVGLSVAVSNPPSDSIGSSWKCRTVRADS